MSKPRLAPGTTGLVGTGWTDALLICRKCSKKLRRGGFGADGCQTLRQAVRGALRASGKRGEIGLLEVGCVGICPKRAVTTLRASQPGTFRIVPAGTPAALLLGCAPGVPRIAG